MERLILNPTILRAALLRCVAALLILTPLSTLADPIDEGNNASDDSDSERAKVIAEWIDTAGYYPPQDERDVADLEVDPVDMQDPDNDGLITMDEYWTGTDPNNADSDGDGAPDGDEVNADHLFGLDASDPTDPNAIPAESFEEYFLSDLTMEGEIPSESETPMLAGEETPETESVAEDSIVSVSTDASGTAGVADTVALPAIPGLRPDPLLYQSDREFDGGGRTLAMIFANGCPNIYRFMIPEWNTFPATQRDLHRFGIIVGMQAWLNQVRQVIPGHPRTCPDVAQTRFLWDRDATKGGLTPAQWQSLRTRMTASFEFVPGAGACSATTYADSPSFVEIRMRNWSQFWTYLHEIGHGVVLDHTNPRDWSRAAARRYRAYGRADWSESHCPLMSYGHNFGFPMPQCVGHPNDELRVNAYYAKEIRRRDRKVCGAPVPCKVPKPIAGQPPSVECFSDVPKERAGEYDDALRRPCWPEAEAPTDRNIEYGSWFTEQYRCSQQDWRLVVIFEPTDTRKPTAGMCFVGIGRIVGNRVVEYFRRGIGAYWIPKDRAGTPIPIERRTKADCGIGPRDEIGGLGPRPVVLPPIRRLQPTLEERSSSLIHPTSADLAVR